MINRLFTVHTKTGTHLFETNFLGFWRQSTNTGNLTNVFDPVIVFDPHERRFVATCAHEPDSTNSGVLIGVSLTEDPRGAWNVRRVPADPTGLRWADQPYVAFNGRHIVVTANLIQIDDGNGGVEGTRLWVWDKAQLYASNNPAATVLTIGGRRSVRPAVNYDAGSTNLYLLANLNTNWNANGYLGWGWITGSLAAPTVVWNTNNFLIVTNHTWVSFPPLMPNGELANFAPQLGATNRIQMLDARIQSISQKRGRVYAAHMVYLSETSTNRTALQWYSIDPVTRSFDFGIFESSSVFYGYPSIAVNDFGDVLIGYARFSSNSYPSAAFRYRRYNQSNPRSEAFSAEQIFAQGVDYYIRHDSVGRNRWGDYTTTMVDSHNGRDFWTFGQFATNHAAGGSVTTSGISGLRWANVSLPFRTNDAFANPVALTGRTGIVSVLVERLTRETGEPNHFGTNYVSVWYSWTATNSGQASFKVSSDRAAIAVYAGLSVSSLTEVARSRRPSISVSLNRFQDAVFPATNGVTYRIAVVGFPNDYLSTDIIWTQTALPYFVEHPHPQTNEVINGYSRTLTGFAIGDPVPTFQWKKNGVNISGATSTNYTITSMTSSHDGSYVLVASNSAGSVSSEATYVKFFAEGTQNLTDGEGFWTNNVYKLQLVHVIGYRYVVYGSTNFLSWTPLETNTVPWTFSDPQATNFPYRFYRTEFLP
jgi:hypothetical protein